MLPSGYDTLTIDEFWYPPVASSGSLDAHMGAPLSTWQNGRVQSFSKGDGKGFGPIAKEIHALGMKLGLHVMHGVPKEAIVHASAYTVLGREDCVIVANLWERWDRGVHGIKPWNGGWGRVNMSASGAQEYFDSIYAQYAEWQIDFIMYGCVFSDDFHTPARAARPARAASSTFTDIEATRRAMDKTARISSIGV